MENYALPPTVYRYRDPARFTAWLRIALWTAVALGVGDALVSILLLIGLSNAYVAGAVGSLWLVMRPLAFILTMIWIYRAAGNIYAFGAEVTFTPGWAVGWFFIPIINIWMSFLVVEEIWRASEDAADWQARKAPWLVVDWWGIPLLAWLAYLFLTYFIGGLIAGDIAGFLNLFAQIWVLYLFTVIAQRICEMQQSQAARLAIV